MEFEIDENESLQCIKENYILFDIKHKYPKSLLVKILTQHQKIFINFFAFVEYYSEFLFQCDNTINELLLCDTPCENIRDKIKEIENASYKFLRHKKIIITTYNSVRDLNPIYYNKKVPKQMVEYTLLKLIDNNSELFRNKSGNYYNPLSSYADMKLYDYKDFPLFGLREIKYYNILNG